MDVYRHKIIVEKLPEIIPFLVDEDEEYFKSILEKSRKLLNEYNWENKVVIDATKREKGQFNSCCKKVISAHYNREDFISLDVYEDLYEYIEKTTFNGHLINSKLLLNRRCNFYKMTPLENAINNSIKLEIIKEFEYHNKEILIKN